MKRPLVLAVLLMAAVSGDRILAFCGFYVGKADTKLFNQASQVALVREGDHTVLTMANDFQGDPKEFALVVPVPTFIERRQIAVVDKGLLDHLDAFSAPRLVEYFDVDPCAPPPMPAAAAAGGGRDLMLKSGGAMRGVTVEATYTVGEYDILILSARESNGLESWLIENGYKIPSGVAPILGSYIKQGMRFFVAKVNLKEQAALGFTFLRPLQVSYETPKFMLPIRLGTVNADGPQELFIYALTKKGRVETTNYRTVKLKSDLDIPIYVKTQFPAFYRATFARSVAAEGMRSVFLEHAWNSGSCDPCSAEPLAAAEAKALGASWADEDSVFVTRLHLRYTRASFPEDLVFQETADRSNFQARYVLRHPFAGSTTCEQGRAYRNALVERWDEEARNLAALTGWRMQDIKTQMRREGARPSASLETEAGWFAVAWQRISGFWGAVFT